MEWEDDIDFIIAYLNKCIEIKHKSERLETILLYLCKEIKKIKDKNG